MSILCKIDPWKNAHCGRLGCLPCDGAAKPSEQGRCWTEGVLYRIDCSICKEREVIATYYGESGRSAYQRGREHLQAVLTEDQDHPMMKHHKEHHLQPNEEDQLPLKYRMTVLKNYRTAVTRKVGEAVRIEGGGGQHLNLNSKSEWNGVSIPRLCVEIREKVSQIELKGSAERVKRMWTAPSQPGDKAQKNKKRRIQEEVDHKSGSNLQKPKIPSMKQQQQQPKINTFFLKKIPIKMSNSFYSIPGKNDQHSLVDAQLPAHLNSIAVNQTSASRPSPVWRITSSS